MSSARSVDAAAFLERKLGRLTLGKTVASIREGEEMSLAAFAVKLGTTAAKVSEVGYLSYSNRYADLLFEVVTRRYDQQRSNVLSTNNAFAEWSEVFPHAACTVTLVDRLVHRSEILEIEGTSYRLKEAKARAAQRSASERAGRARREHAANGVPLPFEASCAPCPSRDADPTLQARTKFASHARATL